MVACDYCGKPSDKVRRMICGPNGSAICDECVLACTGILFNEFKTAMEIPFIKERNYTPVDPPCQTC